MASGTAPRQLPDKVVTAAALLLLLDARTSALTEDELVREMAGRDPEFAEADQIRRAIRDLERFGLVRAADAGLLITRAAQHFHRLMQHA